MDVDCYIVVTGGCRGRWGRFLDNKVFEELLELITFYVNVWRIIVRNFQGSRRQDICTLRLKKQMFEIKMSDMRWLRSDYIDMKCCNGGLIGLLMLHKS